MSLFDQNNPKEMGEELLYQAIKEELDPLLDKLEEKQRGTSDGVYLIDSERKELAKLVSRVVLQFVWRKLGMKIPDYTRQVLDSDYNVMEIKTENK